MAIYPLSNSPYPYTLTTPLSNSPYPYTLTIPLSNSPPHPLIIPLSNFPPHPYLIPHEGIPADNKWEKASKNDIHRLVTELLSGRYSVSGRGQYRDEFVTCGGVPLKEVSFEAFESKVVRGLHLCGEVRG